MDSECTAQMVGKCLLLCCLLMAGNPAVAQSQAIDSDGDGIIDSIDVDDDNDTIPDTLEGLGDQDGDGVVNANDRDSDNDGLSDLVEALVDASLREALDSNLDGQLDSAVSVGANGLADAVETQAESSESRLGLVDSDQDGVPDFLDLDSDNDGLVDLVEAGSVDQNRDGRLDRFRDTDGDGLDDVLAILPIAERDTDDDGVADFRDIDSDNDGLSDRLESVGADVDNDGVVDGFTDTNGDGLHDDHASESAPLDSDADRQPNHLDLDSDNDGVFDAIEAAPSDPPPTDTIPTEPQQPPVASDGDGNSVATTGLPVTGREGSVLGAPSGLIVTILLLSGLGRYRRFHRKGGS